MMMWKPIETAPVGETVLVFRPHAKMRGGKICFGLLQRYVCDEKPEWSVDGSRVKAKGRIPTHWMPLPDLPNRNPYRPATAWITNGVVPTPPLSALMHPSGLSPVTGSHVSPPMAEPEIEKTAPLRILPGGRVSRAEAAKIFGRTPKTMAEWASKGWGPRCIHVGGRVFHDYAECLAMARGERPLHD